MIVTAWRIVKARYAADAFSGEGARVEGGRWNSPGSPVVYTSQSAALAALELLVHLGRSAVLSTYVLVPCSFDERLVSRIDPGGLPANWRSYPAPVELQFLGDNWLRTALSAVLEVPSAVIEIDSNYLLNPRHRDFREIRIERPRPFPIRCEAGERQPIGLRSVTGAAECARRLSGALPASPPTRPTRRGPSSTGTTGACGPCG